MLKSSTSQRAFASTATCRKAAITTRILQLVHELCTKRIHVTKRDLFYTDVKLFEVGLGCPLMRRDWIWGLTSGRAAGLGGASPGVGMSHGVTCMHTRWFGERRSWTVCSPHPLPSRAPPQPTDPTQDQGHSDAVLDDVACLLGCTRSSLNGEGLSRIESTGCPVPVGNPWSRVGVDQHGHRTLLPRQPLQSSRRRRAWWLGD